MTDIGGGFTGFNRIGYLRFDLSGLSSAEILSATLSLTLSSIEAASAANTTYQLRALSDDGWAENMITFDNTPAAGASLGTFTIPTAVAISE